MRGNKKYDDGLHVTSEATMSLSLKKKTKNVLLILSFNVAETSNVYFCVLLSCTGIEFELHLAGWFFVSSSFARRMRNSLTIVNMSI